MTFLQNNPAIPLIIQLVITVIFACCLYFKANTLQKNKEAGVPIVMVGISAVICIWLLASIIQNYHEYCDMIITYTCQYILVGMLPTFLYLSKSIQKKFKLLMGAVCIPLQILAAECTIICFR